MIFNNNKIKLNLLRMADKQNARLISIVMTETFFVFINFVLPGTFPETL